jgi:hypothetical protein
MAATYWLSFRIADDATYEDRYNALVGSINSVSSKWWVDTTAFFVFRSETNIDDLATRIKSTINPTKDIVLIGMPDFKSARIIGAYQDPDIFDLMPFTKKA